MLSDNRKHPRFYPNGLAASINIVPPPPDDKITIDGTVINISYTGIKIKLNTPLNTNVAESTLLINLTLPESGVPITIRGVIKHLTDASECGLQYIGNEFEDEVDDLMFECIKISDNSVQENLEYYN
ncbi:MAG: PilZ domain-containing protein [Methylococcales bacterium]